MSQGEKDLSLDGREPPLLHAGGGGAGTSETCGEGSRVCRNHCRAADEPARVVLIADLIAALREADSSADASIRLKTSAKLGTCGSENPSRIDLSLPGSFDLV